MAEVGQLAYAPIAIGQKIKVDFTLFSEEALSTN